MRRFDRKKTEEKQRLAEQTQRAKTTPYKERGQISSTPSEKGLEAQRQLKEQQQKTEQVTDKLENQVLPKVEQALQNTVIKMNNDKYNTEQKSEPNRNFTPFVPLEKKRVMPEKQNKIPGVIQHSRPKRKKTENKW